MMMPGSAGLRKTPATPSSCSPMLVSTASLPEVTM
jgi:hypothetical protein